MKIALCQINSIVGDMHGNAAVILDYYARAKKMGADLCVFPELALTGYPPMDLIDRKDFVDDALEIINTKIAPQVKDCGLLVGSINHNANDGKRYFNSAFFMDEGRIISVINKQLLPTYDLFDEMRYYQDGKPTSPVYYKGLRLGIHICEDMWRNESPYSQKLYEEDPVDHLGEQGVDIFINLSASPFSRAKDLKRHNVMAKYAAKWKVPFVMVNTVGANDSAVFDGRSKLVSKTGQILVEAKAFEEDLVVVDTEKEYDPYSVVKHSDVETVHSALVLGLKDYIKKNGLKSVVIGLSGGIDSALCAAIASEALGPQNVTGITMPTRFSSKGSVDHSEQLCKNLGIKLIKFSIEDIFNKFAEGLKDNFGKTPSGMTLENLQPRVRGTILMAYTNSTPGNILVAPGNKSEIATGYCTLYGDTCGALALIGDVYKTEVYELAKFINRNGEVIPKEIIDKQPSAELRPDQYDTDSLPPYEVLDEILRLYIEEKCSPKEIYTKVSAKKDIVDKAIDLVIKSEFKRRQLPPVIKVSSKAFVLDRRWPVVHKFR